VRTKTVKRASRVIIEKYYPRLVTDFHVNKRVYVTLPINQLLNSLLILTWYMQM
jgi:small subunit ribosomal protein S17e